MRLSIIFLIFISTYTFSQPDLDIFKDYEPKWIRATFDTSALDIVGYDDHSRMHFVQSIQKDGYIYVLYKYNLQDRFNDGGYMEKIDESTGEESWHIVYDLRTIEIGERPDRFRINDNGTVEIIGGRVAGQTSEGYWQNTFVRRMYSNKSGEFISWNGVDKTDSLKALFYNSWGPIVYFKDSIYMESDIFVSADRDSINYIFLDSTGYEISRGATYFEASSDSVNTIQSMLYKDDTTLVTSWFSESTYFQLHSDYKFHYYINLYNNKDMQMLKSIDLTNDFKNSKNRIRFELEYVDEDIMAIYHLNEPEPLHYEPYLYFYDYDGNRVDSVDLKKYNLLVNKIKKISKNEYLIVGTYPVGSYGDYNLYFYKKTIGNDLVLLRRFEMEKENEGYHIYPQNIFINAGNAIIVGKYRKKVDFGNDFLYPITICFKNDDIFTATKEITDLPQVPVSPNPTKDYLHISCEATADVLEIIDQMGRIIMEKENINCKEEIDVSKLNSGMYFIRVSDKKGKLIGISKFGKI